MQTVGVSDFVRRQIKGTGKTYSTILTFQEIASIAEKKLNNGNFKNGYRDGVVLIDVPKQQINLFICPLTKLKESTTLKAQMVKRREDEEPYIQVRALDGEPLKTSSVELILYRKDVLEETNENTTKCQWELIAFQAIPEEVKNMPMGPVTMMRNQLQLPGGTKGFYESEKWAESVKFWQRFAVLDD